MKNGSKKKDSYTMNESLVRFLIFFLSLIAFSTLEFFFQYRKRTQSRKSRWPANLAMIFIGGIAVKIALPTGMAVFSELASSKEIGLFNLFEMSFALELALSIIILDLLVYIQHVLTHKIDIFWRFHRVHHADTDLDTTSALRFHPIEILGSIAYKSFWVMVFGFSYETIFIFEIILNFMAMFNHSNIKLPHRLEKLLRLVIVTPQMHIMHHSIHQYESDRNYGFNLSIWDKLFGTYISDFSSEGVIGQLYYRACSEHKLWALLKLPFKKI